MAQTMEHDAGELRVCILPLEELLTNQHRLDRQTVGQAEQHSAVMEACRVFHLVCRQLIQPLLQFLFQCRGHEDGAAGRRRFGAFQDEGSGAALQQSSRVELGRKFEEGFYAKQESPSPQAVPAAGEPTISMTALLELLKDADPEVKAQLRLALLT